MKELFLFLHLDITVLITDSQYLIKDPPSQWKLSCNCNYLQWVKDFSCDLVAKANYENKPNKRIVMSHSGELWFSFLSETNLSLIVCCHKTFKKFRMVLTKNNLSKQ